MKSLFKYLLLIVIGILIGFFLLKRDRGYQYEQVDIIKNGIQNVRKLVVAEETFTEYYNYNDAKFYFFDSKLFEKHIILLVKAKVMVSYDLTKMETELDSINKKIIIKSIPKEELNIVPTYKYYDFDQSVFNTFSKEELNRFQDKSMKRLVEDLDVTNSKSLAKKRLIEALEQVWSVAKLMGWTIEDQTEHHIINTLISPTFKG